MLGELPFYNELNIVQTVTTIKKYARSFNNEMIKDKDRNMNNSLVRLKASKPVIEDFFLRI